MVRTYYHGTSSHRQSSIDKHGLCPPSSCPNRDFPLKRCVEDGVYVFNDLEDAVAIAEAEVREPNKPMVYAIRKISKACDVYQDPEMEGYGAYVIANCGCVPPSHKCVLDENGFCQKWVKV